MPGRAAARAAFVVGTAYALVSAYWGAGETALLDTIGGELEPRARPAAWVAAVVLTLYGGALTAAGVLVESGAIDPAADADRRALRWHAFLWDPWFLVWGLLLLAALRRSRR